jgi:RimJ/RimL family protein N-acetyltransferase
VYQQFLKARPVKPEIKNFSEYSHEQLFEMFRDIYATSEGMSEILEDKYPDTDSFVKDLETLQQQPGAIALAAGSGDMPVAYLTIRPRQQSRLRHTADLNMGVVQQFRGQGMGTMLLLEGLKRAFALNELEIIYLMVRSDNLPAIRLYMKTGFEPLAVLARDTKIDGKYFDGLLMRKFIYNNDPQTDKPERDG